MTEEKSEKPILWLDIPQCQSTYEEFRQSLAEINPEGEPIPNFNLRYAEKLESVLGSVQIRADRLGYSIPEIAVSYYIKIAKGQAFFNGNKRMSVVLMGLFLFLNGYYLAQGDFADITLVVAEDKKTSFDDTLKALTEYFSAQIQPKP